MQPAFQRSSPYFAANEAANGQVKSLCCQCAFLSCMELSPDIFHFSFELTDSVSEGGI